MKKTKVDIARAARLLGASRVVDIGPMEHTPFGMLALTDRVRRLRSTGPGGSGRPSNPGATVPRIVKFQPRIWKLLARLAREQSALTGRQVSPAQVASILLEQVLKLGPPVRRRAQ